MSGWRVAWAGALLIPLMLSGRAYPTLRPTRLILVVPPGETLTAKEYTAYRAHAQAAIDWWADVAPNPVALPLGDTEIITPDVDVYHNLRDWSMPYLVENNPGLTVFLIDNSASGQLLFGDSGGESQDYYGAIWAVMNDVPDPEAIVTHEIGHVVYHLDHPASCGDGAIDIMCYLGMVQAYRLHFVGCASLAALGASCAYTHLPLVLR